MGYREKFLREPVVTENSIRIRKKAEGKTRNQDYYVRVMRRSDITICEGPAGTGKTYLAVGVALNAIHADATNTKRIVITRPMVTVEEDAGFYPGDPNEKAAPFLQPFYESLRKFCFDDADFRSIISSFTKDNLPKVEIAPIGLMRGRTFDDCFVILDEAQNLTRRQMLMFLTRMGQNCKLVITGDLDQSDLVDRHGDPIPNGLGHAIDRLSDREFQRGVVNVCHLGVEDILRNDLIAEVIPCLMEPDAA